MMRKAIYLKGAQNIMVWWALKSIATIVAFTVLAIYFNHWWIALFAFLFMDSYSSEKRTDISEGKPENESGSSKTDS